MNTISLDLNDVLWRPNIFVTRQGGNIILLDCREGGKFWFFSKNYIKYKKLRITGFCSGGGAVPLAPPPVGTHDCVNTLDSVW